MTCQTLVSCRVVTSGQVKAFYMVHTVKGEALDELICSPLDYVEHWMLQVVI